MKLKKKKSKKVALIFPEYCHDQTKSLALLNVIVIVLATLNMNNIRAFGS